MNQQVKEHLDQIHKGAKQINTSLLRLTQAQNTHTDVQRRAIFEAMEYLSEWESKCIGAIEQAFEQEQLKKEQHDIPNNNSS